jgi:hypothetical protein
VTNSFLVLGWSANIGHEWSEIADQLNSATFTGGLWSGALWNSSAYGGFLGVSQISFGSLSPDPTLSFNIFGAGPNALGNPITSGFDLFVIVPEPTAATFTILGLTILSLRRKQRNIRH